MKTDNKRSVLFFILVPAILITLGFSAMSQESKFQKIEDKSLVCMLKNRTMGITFVPVIVDGKTYYGCCEMCTATLQQNSKERYANDPVTGRQIDKAKAIIGAYPAGEVFYFESEDSFQAFSEKLR